MHTSTIYMQLVNKTANGLQAEKCYERQVSFATVLCSFYWFMTTMVSKCRTVMQLMLWLQNCRTEDQYNIRSVTSSSVSNSTWIYKW